MKASMVLCALMAFLAVAGVVQAMAPGSNLTVGYYNGKCSNVESIVYDAVKAALDADITKGAALLRLLFHDCFVGGCDGSVLIDPTDANPYPEKTSGANIGIRALDVIDTIKANLEAACPNTVSCADIVAFAFAARDASVYLSKGGVSFAVPAGRLDGVVSSAADADGNLPGSTFEVAKLISSFAGKGFTPEELVILSGAHSVGRAHCSSFSGRLAEPAGEINPYFRDGVLTADCAAAADPMVANNIRDQSSNLSNLTSYVVPAAGGDLLDNSYYHNNLNNLVLFHSDWALVGNKATVQHVHEYADNATLWNLDFSDALVKLSKLRMPPGSTGEIRKTCRAFN